MSERCPSDSVVELRGVSRHFGATIALDEVNLAVPRGSVFGLVGQNGAGKTTLLKHVLGLLKAQTGEVAVFGHDPVVAPEVVLGQIGYLSEDNDLPGWMRVRELMRYQRAFYSAWDEAYAEDLRETFSLDPNARIKSLSRGQRARVGLLVSLAHRPPLLVLDEPSSGLDPVVRRDILVAIIRTISDEGRTVLFSSHLLDEVERVSDHVAIMDRGKIVLRETADVIRESFQWVEFHCGSPQSGPPPIPGTSGWRGSGSEWSAICHGPIATLAEAAREVGATIASHRAASLDEIFVARVEVAEGALREAVE